MTPTFCANLGELSLFCHLKVDCPGVVLVHLTDHLHELLLGGVLAHGPQHHPQLLECDALISIHIKQVENGPRGEICKFTFINFLR